MNGHAGAGGVRSAFIWHNVKFLLAGGYRLPGAHRPVPGSAVPADFFGVCVAANPDPAGDRYVLERLRDMGVRHVRMDFSYASAQSFPERFLERLIADGARVCLHLVQPEPEAAAMSTPEARERWRAFVSRAVARFGRDVEMIEVGATVNRRRWCGYRMPGFLAAWQIAREEIARAGVRLAGPNVTDFEPVYNVALLGLMRARGCLPAVHTDNLFVERATEPEAYDHKIAGRILAPLLKYNLLKKAALLRRIAASAGVPSTMCTHVAWSGRRIARILEDVEEKQADYTARYLALAAAGGSLARVYWGPLIGQREGLIDDGTSEYPEIPHVTFYGQANGPVSGYRVRPALAALRTAAARLVGATFVRQIPTRDGLTILEFDTPAGRLHAAWTVNARVARLADAYPLAAAASPSAIDRDGAPLPSAPDLITERPVYLLWPADGAPATPPHAGPLRRVRVCATRPWRIVPIRESGWEGLLVTEAAARSEGIPPGLRPDALEQEDGRQVLRDKRNSVWSMADPRGGGRKLIVKRFNPPRGIRRLLQRWKPSRGQRSWNGTHELLRRGIVTPVPVAYFQHPGRAVLNINYFLYEAFDATGSVRDAFTEFAKGGDRHGGVAATDFYAQLAGFLVRVHERGVFFRDLSAGNVMMRIHPGKPVAFALIDTARARFWNHPVTLWQRLKDLMRICHPLHAAGRTEFLSAYCAGMGIAWSPWMRIPFAYYDLKHWLKKLIRPFRPGRR